jgi:hypothetical protein
MQGAVANEITDHILSAQNYSYMVMMPVTDFHSRHTKSTR